MRSCGYSDKCVTREGETGLELQRATGNWKRGNMEDSLEFRGVFLRT